MTYYSYDEGPTREVDYGPDEEAEDEQSLEDLILHLQKAESHLNLFIHLNNNGSGDSEAATDTLGYAHDRVVRALNTAQYLKEEGIS